MSGEIKPQNAPAGKRASEWMSDELEGLKPALPPDRRVTVNLMLKAFSSVGLPWRTLENWLYQGLNELVSAKKIQRAAALLLAAGPGGGRLPP
jgi:hypothetical protein